MLEKTIKRSLLATAEVFFPENESGAPDYKKTDLVENCWQWMKKMPFEQRIMIYALYICTEFAFPLLIPALGRLSNLSIQKRERLMHRLMKSKIGPLKFLADTLKTIQNMIFLCHPSAIEYCGIYKKVAYPEDNFYIPLH